MNVSYSSKNIDITDDMKEYLEKKFKKFKFFHDQILNIGVILSNERGRYTTEIKISANHNTFFATATASSWKESFDSVVDKIEAEITKTKDRITDHRV